MARTPAPPADLDRTGQALWKRTLAGLRKQGTWSDLDFELLGDYCRARQRARHALKGLPRKGGRYVLTTKGSQDQDVQHPNVKTAREAERDALEYARELLIPPRTRQRAGVATGGPGQAGGTFGDAL